MPQRCPCQSPSPPPPDPAGLHHLCTFPAGSRQQGPVPAYVSSTTIASGCCTGVLPRRSSPADQDAPAAPLLFLPLVPFLFDSLSPDSNPSLSRLCNRKPRGAALIPNAGKLADALVRQHWCAHLCTPTSSDPYPGSISTRRPPASAYGEAPPAALHHLCLLLGQRSSYLSHPLWSTRLLPPLP